MVSTAIRDLLRPLRVPAYTFLVITVMLQVADFMLSSMPIRPLAVIWRFGALGSASNIVGNILLLTLLFYGLALALGDRRVVVGVAIFSALVAIVLFLSAGSFTLDALQLRAKIEAKATRQFDLASGEALFKFIIEGIVATLFAVSAFQAWRAANRELQRGDRTNDEMLVIRGPGSR
jgi:hypothetical protein